MLAWVQIKLRKNTGLTINRWPVLLDHYIHKIMKGGALRKSIDYTLNQLQYLADYCECGDLMISNTMAENAIRPFAIGRKSWLFADTRKGAEASALCYLLIETVKANILIRKPTSNIFLTASQRPTPSESSKHYCPGMWNWARLSRGFARVLT